MDIEQIEDLIRQRRAELDVFEATLEGALMAGGMTLSEAEECVENLQGPIRGGARAFFGPQHHTGAKSIRHEFIRLA
jgi:hypothetical protein